MRRHKHMENNANSVDNTVENVEETNSQEVNQGTQENDNSTNDSLENVAQVIDYQKKFSESAKEAQRLYEENKRLKEQFELKDKMQHNVAETTDNLYPGFEDLDEDAKSNLIAYTNAVTNKAAETLRKDPAYAFAQRQYNETVWDNAFRQVSEKYPELVETKDSFKAKYFNVNNVPQNIADLLDNAAKVHLFDKAKEIGMKEAEKLNSRVELERKTAGPRDVSKTTRSLEEWQRLATENPAKFAQMKKEFQADMSSGKI